MRTIAVMNNKGGVGKTVTAINLADILVRDYRQRVLLVDCDGQMNLSEFCLPSYDPDEELNLYHILTGQGEDLWSDNVERLSDGLTLLPASPDLYELDLQAVVQRAGDPYGARLRDFLEAARMDGEADFAILDCAPGYTCATVAALMTADDVVIPVGMDGFSFFGLRNMQVQLQSLRRVGVAVHVAGVLLTQWRASDVVRQGEQLLRQSGLPVFRQVIRRTEKVPESTFERQPVTRYSRGSAASVDYRRWVQEYLGGVFDEL